MSLNTKEQKSFNHSAQGKKVINALLLACFLLLLVLLNYKLFVTDRVPVLGFVGVGILWLLYWIVNRSLGFASPLDFPILALLCLLPLSLFISVDWTLSLPKVYGLLIGVIVFFVLKNFIHDDKRLRLSVIALVLIAFTITLLGLIALQWTGSRFAWLDHIFAVISSLKAHIPAFNLADTVHANTIGGALAFLLPMLVSLLWDGGAFRWSASSFLYVIFKIFIGFLILLMLLTVLLTRSRGAILGSAVGLFLLVLWKKRRLALLMLLVVLIVLVAAHFLLEGGLPGLLAMIDAGEDDTLFGRLKVWSSTLALIQDFPLTGTGIGTYTQVFADHYTFNVFPLYPGNALHAHNSFLSVAVDLGLPALILYVALLTSFFYMALSVSKKAQPLVKVLILGLACGMLAHQVFGIFDAFLLGTKLGIIMWICLGLMAALYVNSHGFEPIHSTEESIESPNREPTRKQRSSVSYQLRAISYQLIAWLFTSFLALSFVNLNMYLSLALAILGGVFLGLRLTKRAEGNLAALSVDSQTIKAAES